MPKISNSIRITLFSSMKTTISCVLIIILTTGLNCNFIDPCGDDSAPAKPFFSIINIHTSLHTIIDTLPSADLKVETLSEPYETSFNKLIINLHSEVFFYATIPNKTPLFVSAGNVFACSPVLPGERGSKEKMDSLIITSDSTFDENHPAGSKLNDVLKYLVGGNSTSSVNNLTDLQIFQNHYNTFRMLLDKQPVAKAMNFKIHYYQSNGAVFTTETPLITFLP